MCSKFWIMCLNNVPQVFLFNFHPPWISNAIKSIPWSQLPLQRKCVCFFLIRRNFLTVNKPGIKKQTCWRIYFFFVFECSKICEDFSRFFLPLLIPQIQKILKGKLLTFSGLMEFNFWYAVACFFMKTKQSLNQFSRTLLLTLCKEYKNKFLRLLYEAINLG